MTASSPAPLSASADHRAGNAGTDDEHIGVRVSVERAARHARRAQMLPERAVGAQFPFAGDHGKGAGASASDNDAQRTPRVPETSTP
jgi:hypothetical protein